jgi:hypothetical protein
VGEFIGAAEQELASSRRRRRPICRLADSVVVPSQQDPPTAGKRARFQNSNPHFRNCRRIGARMKLSSFLGWRSRTLTAAFTARNHEEQSRTARGMRHARPRPHAVGLPRPNPLDRVPTLRPPRPLQHRPPHREIRRRQAPELRHILANCPKAKSFSIHDRCQVRYGKDTRASTPGTLRE